MADLLLTAAAGIGVWTAMSIPLGIAVGVSLRRLGRAPSYE